MVRYNCSGRLNITMREDMPEEARIHFIHCGHPPYVNIAMSLQHRKTIKEMKQYSPSKIWDYILKQDPETELTEKQVQTEWTRINEDHWRLDQDQVTSASKLLENFDQEKVEIIPITQRKGSSSIAFAFTKILDGIGSDIEEVLMDSTWKTNALGYELFAIVGEMNGQAIPLAFLLNVMTEAANEGTKELILRDFISWITQRCPNIKFTLTNKDITEINAFRTELPHAKHQLCYWHGLRYIEKRLGENKPPAAYDPRVAHQIFSFIDPTWAPGVTMGAVEDGVHPVDAEIPEPAETLKIKINLKTMTADIKRDWHNMSKPDEYRSMAKELACLKDQDLKENAKAELLADIEADRLRPRGTYHTDVETMTCSCPSYLISRWLLCKHLVREVNERTSNLPINNLSFFRNLRRNHTTPFYNIPGLHAPLTETTSINEAGTPSSSPTESDLNDGSNKEPPARSSPFCSDDEGEASERVSAIPSFRVIF
ncbi:hypothetical protein EV361DRAFT_856344 [Lentinula raphanica]|nr:hypothetical protein EV361DRAFT_856344 [Lentinula raphanica]